MKTNVILTIFTVITCLIISCSKSINPNEGTELKKEKFTFKSIVEERTFERNASNKIISIRDSAKSQMLSGMNFEYGANGRISKVNGVDQSGTTGYLEFTYNPDGTISKRQLYSGSASSGDDFNTYGYDASGHLVVDSQFTRGSGSVYSLLYVSKFKYTGDNVTEAEGYVVTNGTAQLKTRRKYEYDNALNPYEKIESYYYYNESASAIYDIPVISSNNIWKGYNATGDGPYELVQTNTFQYNSSNAPWKIKPDMPGNATQPLLEIEYFY